MRYFADGLVGTPEQIVERLAKASQSGLGYLIVRFVDAAYDRTSIDLFANKVIPELA
jgi:alkanesulfonate monooxygenase SsuD/methylene tetrahydromethanopterin reductase-like flavin-dependent oxidoreductase (luciferase family)